MNFIFYNVIDKFLLDGIQEFWMDQWDNIKETKTMHNLWSLFFISTMKWNKFQIVMSLK